MNTCILSESSMPVLWSGRVLPASVILPFVAATMIPNIFLKYLKSIWGSRQVRILVPCLRIFAPDSQIKPCWILCLIYPITLYFSWFLQELFTSVFQSFSRFPYCILDDISSFLVDNAENLEVVTSSLPRQTVNVKMIYGYYHFR